MFLLHQAVIYQISRFDALRVGHYDGKYPVSILTKHGDFGVGTFNGLDGEMVVFGGHIYRIDAYGSARAPKPNTDTPFAFDTYFHSKCAFKVTSPMTSLKLQAAIDTRYPDGMLAIHIHGRFTELLARSFAPQLKPYLPFAQIGGRQSMLPYGTADGDFVGFRMPKSVGTLNVPGYHFHFISDDRKRGGHVLAFKVQSGTVELMPVSRITGPTK